MSAASPRVDHLAASASPRAALILMVFAAAIFAVSGLADAGRAFGVSLTGERARGELILGSGDASVRFKDRAGAIRLASVAHDWGFLEEGRVRIAYAAERPDQAYVLDGAAAWRGAALRLGLAAALLTMAAMLWPRRSLSSVPSSRSRRPRGS